MFCPKCGNKVDDDDIFCVVCGTKLKRFTSMKKEVDLNMRNEAAVQEENKAAFSQEVVNVESNSDDTKVALEQEPEDKEHPQIKKGRTKKNKALLITFAVIIAAVGIAIANGRKSPNSSYDALAEQNFSNGGLLAYNGSDTYMITKYHAKNKYESLVKVDEKGKMTMLLKEGPRDIRIKNGKLYYVMSGDTCSLNEMNLDGTGQRTLVQEKPAKSGTFNYYDVNAKGDTLYYTYKDDLYKYDLLSEKKTKLRICSTGVICNETMFLIDEYAKKLYKMDLNTEESKVIANHVEANRLVVVDDDLWLLGEKGLMRMPIQEEGPIEVIVSSSQISSFLVERDRILFYQELNDHEADMYANIFADYDDDVLWKYNLAMFGTGKLGIYNRKTKEKSYPLEEDNNSIYMGMYLFKTPQGKYYRSLSYLDQTPKEVFFD